MNDALIEAIKEDYGETCYCVEDLAAELAELLETGHTETVINGKKFVLYLQVNPERNPCPE